MRNILCCGLVWLDLLKPTKKKVRSEPERAKSSREFRERICLLSVRRRLMVVGEALDDRPIFEANRRASDVENTQHDTWAWILLTEKDLSTSTIPLPPFNVNRGIFQTNH